LLNHYLQRTGDYQGMVYCVTTCRALRKVSLLRHEQQLNDVAVSNKACLKYAEFANLAEHFTKVSRTLLIITHGYSGSGKSTFAGQLAEKIGALQIRSDIERKRSLDTGHMSIPLWP
jgi:2-phosphoglycerate kinase